MKKLSLQNAQTMLSRAEMIKINGGYTPPVNQAGWNPIDYVKGVVIDFLVNTVASGVYDGAKQSAEAQVNGGTQVMIPGAVGTTTSLWVK
nr:hypothetical protein [uncultured Flavobacterium sp.]